MLRQKLAELADLWEAEERGLITLEESKTTQLRGLLSADSTPDPIPMTLWCPGCCARHIDTGEFALKVHHTHSCQRCGLTWRPAVVPTVGVHFLPGFKNEREPAPVYRMPDGTFL